MTMITIPGYQVTEQLYESGHSLVFRGKREVDNQPVILKMLKKEYPTPEEVARFRREYEMTRTFNTDGIIKVYGLEKFQNTLVMILDDFGGDSVTQILSTYQPELEEFLRFAIQASDILSKVHQKHIMHKDINPANLIWKRASGLPGSGQPASGLPGSGQPASGLPGSGQPASGLPGVRPTGVRASGGTAIRQPPPVALERIW